MKQWYESLFENYGKSYDKESYTQGTAGECDFIEREIGRDKGKRILDIGCGTGRHAIELARRGYAVTGIDLSESQLERAREKASEQNLSVVFLRGDARQLSFAGEFDLALMLCEGAFPLMETDEMNFAILRGAAGALKAGGKLIMTTLSGLFPLHHSIERFCAANAEPGKLLYRKGKFNLLTFRDHNVTTVADDSGKRKELECDERYYVPPEMTWLLKSAGFRTVDIFGAKLGAFSRSDALTVDDFEMLILAEK